MTKQDKIYQCHHLNNESYREISLNLHYAGPTKHGDFKYTVLYQESNYNKSLQEVIVKVREVRLG